MAAVMALVFLPALAAIALMSGALDGDVSYKTIGATLIFAAMAGGVFVSVFRLAQSWEAEAD